MTPLDRVRRYVAAASTMPGAVVNNSADAQWITVDDLRAVLALVPSDDERKTADLVRRLAAQEQRYRRLTP